jgi:hypothetical protein
VFPMKSITVKQVTKSKRFADKPAMVASVERPVDRVVTYKVSRLTKPWALKGTESAMRALAGNALDGVEIRFKTNASKPVAKKRALAHA